MDTGFPRGRQGLPVPFPMRVHTRDHGEGFLINTGRVSTGPTGMGSLTGLAVHEHE
jgi:hypothetical protein